jgi:ABC-type Fe3+/spermidine/putrescine transport system ATPase subunit
VLEVRGLAKAWPGFALCLDLSLRGGEIAAVLGPSGCGKSTLLRLVAGLERPDSGAVLVGGIDVSGTPPERRGIGMVFQDFALFPHLSVRRNIEYGPRMRGLPRPARRRGAEAIAESFEIAPLLDRSPYSLSGGEQQRVALARALAARPSLMLLDEPLSSLDASLRRRLRAEIGERLREAGMTAVLVTHDAEEAFGVADRVCLMRAGRIDAEGPPEGLYASPPTAWSASFLGRGPVLEALGLEARDGRSIARTAIGEFAFAPGGGGEGATGPASIFFPASSPRPAPSSGGSDERVERNHIRGRVASTSFAGRFRRLSLACPALAESSEGGGEMILELELDPSFRPAVGETLHLEVAAGDCRLLPGLPA